MSTDALTATADISECGRYRYRLTRTWDEGPRMVFVMLNPSTADARVDDPTIRRCMRFAAREACGGIIVVNLFALRVTRPVHLFDGTIAEDPNGPENVGHIRRVLHEAAECAWPVVCAWGAFPGAGKSKALAHLRERWRAGMSFRCLGRTADGSPRHPLYLKSDTPLEVWP